MSLNIDAYLDTFYSRLLSDDTTAMLVTKRDGKLMLFQAQSCFLVSSFRLHYQKGNETSYLQYCVVDGLEPMDDFDNIAVLIDQNVHGVRVTVLDVSYGDIIYSSKDDVSLDCDPGVLTCLTISRKCLYYMIAFFGYHTNGFLLSNSDKSYESLLSIIEKGIFNRQERPSLQPEDHHSLEVSEPYTEKRPQRSFIMAGEPYEQDF